jgi:RHH-type proline utilization regulon transcriptional repressor/proline dehydrogenase/delta 1-pyrroline-5-carboxylate dehydrogenase
MDARLPQNSTTQRAIVRTLLQADESDLVRSLLSQDSRSERERSSATDRAAAIVSRAREQRESRSPLEQFLQEFGLSTNEGIALLCLAEALLRIPDGATADNLIAEKLQAGRWGRTQGQSDSTWVNLIARGLSITKGVVQLDSHLADATSGMLRGLVNRLGEPVVRTAIRQAMRVMGDEFVLGRTIEEALSRAARSNIVASFDMLGEGARTSTDADRYHQAYSHCIRTIAGVRSGGLYAGHNVSIKLSALHPRYEHSTRKRVLCELLPRLVSLALQARAGGISLTVDAEEAARLDLSLDIIEALTRNADLQDWNGLGLAVQCYSKRAPAVLDWLIALGQEARRRFMVRLVKGAYWDTEIKRAQELGLKSYPVFTRKASTDLCYLLCARKVLAHPETIYPQFATHNAHSVAAILEAAGSRRDFEFQRLHGMGELLYAAGRETNGDMPMVRVYAPVGAHRDLLAYLVRRLLENGANASFVNRYMDENVAIDRLIRDPADTLRSIQRVPNPHIPLPRDLYGKARSNSEGLDLSDPAQTDSLLRSLASLQSKAWEAAPIINGARSAGERRRIVNPANLSDVVGCASRATASDVERAIAAAVAAQPGWDSSGADSRACALERAADAFEASRDELISLLVREAGKTLPDAVAEVRETVDFCRYYATQAREQFGEPKALPGPTGEANLYSLHGRGAFVCISPWNFPLAIFVGQVTAALAAGNSVLAKPAEQTPLVAAAAVSILHRSGVPQSVLHFVPGRGENVGSALVADDRIAGVAMTGSTATAKRIATALAARPGPIVPLIAETGGQNAMFVDSSALPEQVVDDVIRSAFHSAGQRCSALRVLYLQEEIATAVLSMIQGVMDELKVGDPAQLCTDVGPVIDAQAREQLLAHVARMRAAGCLLHATKLSVECERGTFVAPHLFEIDSITELEQEHFGPLLHVIRYRSRDLARHLEELHGTGYGLTLGIHTRIEAAAKKIFQSTSAGNVYVNRNMIGAVVGVQPFGGHGLSGTGPKAGGPLYLQRFAAERVLTINTTAAGGNVALLRAQVDE